MELVIGLTDIFAGIEICAVRLVVEPAGLEKSNGSSRLQEAARHRYAGYAAADDADIGGKIGEVRFLKVNMHKLVLCRQERG